MISDTTHIKTFRYICESVTTQLNFVLNLFCSDPFYLRATIFSTCFLFGHFSPIDIFIVQDFVRYHNKDFQGSRRIFNGNDLFSLLFPRRYGESKFCARFLNFRCFFTFFVMFESVFLDLDQCFPKQMIILLKTVWYLLRLMITRELLTLFKLTVLVIFPALFCENSSSNNLKTGTKYAYVTSFVHFYR